MFRKSMVLLLLLGCGGVLSGADYSAQIASVKAGKTAEAKAVWWGYDKTDATKCLQAALDSGARKVIVDNVGSDWIIGPIAVPSNVELVFQDGVVMRAKPGVWQEKQGRRFVQRRMFEIHGKKNVTLRGIGRVKLEFPASEQKDHRHTVSILDSDGVTVDNFEIERGGGDCVYVGSQNCRNIRLENLRCRAGFRQGLSVTGADNLYVKNCVFADTKGTAPEAGLDLEPNYPDGKVGLRNIVFENCQFINNNTFGIYVANNSRKKIDVTFKNCLIKGNSDGIGVGHVGHPTTPKDGTPGTLAFLNCRIEGNRNMHVMVGHHLPNVKLIFRDCTVDARGSRFQPVRLSSDNPDDIDGLEITNLTVIDDVKRDPIFFESRFGNGLVAPKIANVQVRDGSGKTSVFNPAELIRKSAPDPVAKAFKVKPIERKDLAPAFARGALAGERIRLRGKNRFLLNAKSGEKIKITFLNKPVHRFNSKPYRDPLEVTIDTPTLNAQKRIYVPFDGKLEYVLEAGETGIYRFNMDARAQTLCVVTDRPGQAYDAGEKLYVFGCSGRLYFGVPAGVKDVRIEMNGAPREASTVHLFDANGKKVAGVDRHGGGKILSAQRADSSKNEIWSIYVNASKLWLRVGEPLVPLLSSDPSNILVPKEGAGKYTVTDKQALSPIVRNGEFRDVAPSRYKGVQTKDFPVSWGISRGALKTGEDHRNRVELKGVMWSYLALPRDGGKFTGEITASGSGTLRAWLSTSVRKPGDKSRFTHKKRLPEFGPFQLAAEPGTFQFSFETVPFETGYLYVSAEDALVSSVSISKADASK